MNHVLRPEDQRAQAFVWRCLIARWHPQNLDRARAAAAGPPLEWSEVLSVAARHRVSELLYDAVRERDLVPERVEQALGGAYERTFCRNLFLLHELQQLSQQLHLIGQDVIALKGAALAATVYRTIGLRPMVDVDVLVRREQAGRITKALEGHGFVQDVEPRPGAALAYENEVALRKPGLETVRLDLHWSLFDSLFYQRHLDLAWFWQTAVVAEYGQASIKVLGPEAQLIHLCGHLAFHHADYPNLLWLNDLVEIVETHRAGIDWDLLVDQTSAMALLLPVQTYLGQIADEWQAPVPQAVLDRLRAQPVSAAEQRAFALHTAKREESLRSRILPDLLELPPGRERLGYMWAKLLPAPDYMKMRYEPAHDAFLPFLYAYHFGVGLFTAAAIVAREAWDRLARRPKPEPDRAATGDEPGGGQR